MGYARGSMTKSGVKRGWWLVKRGEGGRLFVLKLVEAAQGFLHPVKLLQGGIFLAPGFYLLLLSRLEFLFAHQEKL